jgi:Family of unknown function (DUF5362)
VLEENLQEKRRPVIFNDTKPTFMEQNQDSSLFGLTIDPISKNHLAEAARWARFLAIVGFIMCGLIVLAGVFAGSIFSSMGNSFGRYESGGEVTNAMGAMTTMMAIFYIVLALLIFLPYLFLYRFGSRMKTALASNDQNILNSSFQNLKIMLRYVGIFTIIGLSFYAIMLLIVLASAGGSRLGSFLPVN